MSYYMKSKNERTSYFAASRAFIIFSCCSWHIGTPLPRPLAAMRSCSNVIFILGLRSLDPPTRWRMWVVVNSRVMMGRRLMGRRNREVDRKKCIFYRNELFTRPKTVWFTSRDTLVAIVAWSVPLQYWSARVQFVALLRCSLYGGVDMRL